MSRIGPYNTKPELAVRSLVHRMGFRFRLYGEDLPGNPDIVLRRHKKVIFVHGCFWHGHKGCKRSKRPSTNIDFWKSKLDKNIARDKRNQAQLKTLAWKYLVVWQCEIGKPMSLHKKIARFLEKRDKTNEKERA